MTGHTPGPWHIRKAITGGDYAITAKDGPHDIIVGEAWFLVGERPHNEIVAAPVEANARLMASAPELLAALKEMEAWTAHAFDADDPDMDLPELSQARAAIANAEGRTP